MYYILNQSNEVLGILDNEVGGASFYNDVHIVKIADDSQKVWVDTLEMEISDVSREYDNINEGNSILFKAQNGRYYIHTIYEMEETVRNGSHFKSVLCFNKAIFDLNKTNIERKKFNIGNSRDVIEYVLGNSGWRLNDIRSTFVSTVGGYEISKGNSMQAMDSFIADYDCEVDAYVEVTNGKISDFVFEVYTQRGGDNGRRYEYRHNLKDISRKSSHLEMVTRLYLEGGANIKGDNITIASVNNGKKFIINEEANDLYNDGSSKYLDGYLQNDTITSPQALLDWGKKELKKLSKPQYQYTVTPYEGDMSTIDIGDRVVVVDHEMTPKLLVSARIIELKNSQSDSSLNQITMGEFITIKPSRPKWLDSLQNKANDALKEAYKKTWRVELMTPDGLDFADKNSKKRIIARVWRGDEDVTAMLVRSAFVWTKIDEGDIIDQDWGLKHLNSGKYIEIGYEESLSTIRCSVKDTLADVPELYAKEEDLKFMSRIKLSDKYPQINAGVQQYVHYDHTNKLMYWTKVTKNDSLVSPEDRKKAESFVIIRTSVDGTVLDFMTVKWGGHGSHFGYEFRNGTPYILSPMTDTSGKNKVVWACEFAYQAGKTITIDSAGVTKLRKLEYRLNRDLRNGYVLGVYGKGDNVTYATYKEKAFMTPGAKAYRNHIINSSHFGIKSDQTYQSSCLDFPYLYTTYGRTYQEGLHTYCIDLRTNTLVYKIDYTLDKGNVNFYHQHGECETINYYYDESGQKHMIQGLVLRNKNASVGTRQNELYSFKETIRVDEIYEEDLDIDDGYDDSEDE